MKNVRIKVTKPAKNIIYMQFDSSEIMVLTTFRIQEYSSCPDPKIQGTVFDFNQFVSSYIKRNGNLDYFSSYGGFNFPSQVLQEFYELFKNGLYPQEEYLFKRIEKALHNWKNQEFCIIGTSKNGKKGYFIHELAHAFYCMSDFYKNEMKKLLYNIKYRKLIDKKLMKMGYPASNLNDELQAYLSTSSNKYLISKFGIKNAASLSKDFKKVFKKFRKEHA